MTGSDSANTAPDRLDDSALGLVRAAITSLVTGHPVLGLAGAVARLRVEPVGTGVQVRVDVAGGKPGPGRLVVRVLPPDVDDSSLIELLGSAPVDSGTLLAVVGAGHSGVPIPAIKALRLLARQASRTESADEFAGGVLRSDRRSSAQRLLSVLNGKASTTEQRQVLHAKFRRMWVPRPTELDDHIRVRPGRPEETAQVSYLVDEVVRKWPGPSDLSAPSQDETQHFERVFAVPELGTPAERRTRRAVIDQLVALLADTRDAVRVAIVGAGGMGKSALAVRLCHLLEEGYQVVGWLSATDAGSWQGSVTLLAERLGLPDDAPAAVFDALAKRRPALVVVDDAREPAEFAAMLPARPGLHVLVTSQSVRWRSSSHVVELEPLNIEEAVDYLLARTGAEDEELARAVAEKVGGYPLALEQAAAAAVDGLSLRGWLERHRHRPSRGASTLRDAWYVRIGLLRERHLDALILLRVLACAGNGAVPAGLLGALRLDLGDEVEALRKDTARRDAAVAELRTQGLIRTGADEETLLVHPLLAELVRDDADFDVIRTALAVGAAAADLIDELDIDDATQWSRVLALSSAAVAASRLVHRELERSPRSLTADVAMAFANHALWLPAAYLHERAAARASYRARLLALALHGDKAAAAAVRDWSGEVSDALTDLEPDELVPAAELGQVARGERSQSAARWLNETAALLADVDVPAAESYARRAMEILPQRGPSTSSTSEMPWRERVRIEILDNLGFLTALGAQPREALRIFDNAVRLQRSFPGGNDDSKHTELLNDRALVLLDVGRYVDAMREFKLAASGALDHPDPAVEHNIANNVAKTERFTWHLREAHGRLRRGLDWLLDRSTPHDVNVLIQQCNLGLVDYDLGTTGEGFELVHGTWKTAADRLGEDDRETMIRRMMLANLQAFRGDFAAANDAVLANLRLAQAQDRPVLAEALVLRAQSAWLSGVAAMTPDAVKGLAKDVVDAFDRRGAHAAYALDLRTAWVLAGRSRGADDGDVRAAALAVRLRDASVGAVHPAALLARARLALVNSDRSGGNNPLRTGVARKLLTSFDSLYGSTAGGFDAELARHGQPAVDVARPGWEAGRLMHLLAADVIDLDAGEQLCWQANAGRLAALARSKEAGVPLHDSVSGSAALYGRFHPWTLLREATAAVIENDPEQLRLTLTAPIWA